MTCSKNRTVAILAVSCLLAVLAVGSANASVVLVGDEMYCGNWNGGSVTAYPLSPSTWEPFLTFCAQGEGILYVNGGAGYRYKVISIAQANDSTPGMAMSSHTAWLYSSFSDGTLAGLIQGNLAQEKAVQYGIWSSLGYTDAALTAHGNFDAQAKATYVSLGWDATPENWIGNGDVRVANLLYMNNNSLAQDVMVLVSNPVVPEPATMGLLGLGLGGLLFRRRGQK